MKRIKKENPNTPEMWDHAYGEYDGGNINEPRFITMLSYIEDRKRVVDLGCGQGTFCYALSRLWSNCEIWGVDFSSKALEWAEKRMGGRINFKLAGVTKTGLESNYFDYVVASEILEHLDEPELLIKEAARLLKKGGKLVLTTPYKDHLPSGDHICEFDYQDVEKMVEKYFGRSWVFPGASGGGVYCRRKEVYPPGGWNLIYCLAIK